MFEIEAPYLTHLQDLLGPVKPINVKRNKNKVVLLEDMFHKNYVLKVYSSSDNRNRNNEAELINELDQNGYFHVPKCLAIFEWGILFEYLGGYKNFAGNEDANFISEKDPIREMVGVKEFIGKTLLELTELSPFTKSFNIQIYKTSRQLIIRSRIIVAKQQFGITDNIGEKILRLLSDMRLEKYTFGILTHGDFRFHNYMISPDFGNYKIIDWEFGDYSNKNRDYATLMLYLVCQNRFWDLPQITLTVIEEMSDFIYDLLYYYMLSLAISWVSHPALSNKAKNFLNYMASQQKLSELTLRSYILEKG